MALIRLMLVSTKYCAIYRMIYSDPAARRYNMIGISLLNKRLFFSLPLPADMVMIDSSIVFC